MELGEILIVVFTGVVAFSTGVYAFLTWRLVSETRRMREVQTEPRVSMSLALSDRFGNGGLELVIRNEGQGAAEKIRFTFEGDPAYFIGHGQRQPIDQIPVIKNGLPYLGPNQDFRFLLGWLFGESFDRANQSPWTFHVHYESLAKKPKEDTYILDFSQFAHLVVGSGSPLMKIEKHLDSIQNEVHHMATGFHKLQVITQTKEQSRKEMEDFRRQQLGKPNDVKLESDDEG